MIIISKILIEGSKKLIHNLSQIEIEPIGVVYCSRNHSIDDNWGNVVSTIELDKSKFNQDALLGLEQFSHCEVIFYMDKVKNENIVTGARHPRNLSHLPKVGIFAQRGKSRPNKIGVSRCKILRVSFLAIEVQGLDAINGTPVIDIKPYMKEFEPIGKVYQPEWTKEVMKNYFAK